MRMYKLLKINKLLFLVSFAIWVVALYFSVCNDKMNIVKSSFPNPIVNVAGSIAASYFILYICRWIEKVCKGRVMDYLLFWGRNTLIVLCAHLTELNCIPWPKVYGLIDCRPVALIVVFCLKSFGMLWQLLSLIE